MNTDELLWEAYWILRRIEGERRNSTITNIEFRERIVADTRITILLDELDKQRET